MGLSAPTRACATVWWMKHIVFVYFIISCWNCLGVVACYKHSSFMLNLSFAAAAGAVRRRAVVASNWSYMFFFHTLNWGVIVRWSRSFFFFPILIWWTSARIKCIFRSTYKFSTVNLYLARSDACAFLFSVQIIIYQGIKFTFSGLFDWIEFIFCGIYLASKCFIH